MLLNTPVTLRSVAPADWPAIAALLQANSLPVAGAREHLTTYLVATVDGVIVGCAGAEVYGADALLRSVAVKPGLFRQGIGSAMVERMIQEARRRDILRLHLLSVTAPEYFAQYGFKRGPIEAAPVALKASAEFQGACPACAAFMSLTLRESPQLDTQLPVAVIGAGPVGLAAVAHLLERGLTPVVFEAGSTVGAHLTEYGHVRLFSPWRYNIDQAIVRLLAAGDWQSPALNELPLAGEVVERVLAPFAALPAVAQALHLNTRVLAVTRDGFDKVKTAGRDAAPLILRIERDGMITQVRARAVIDASGTWATPNPVGANGLPASGEREHAKAIYYGIPDVLGAARHRYAGKHTLVVGAGHSAANTLLALAELTRSDPQTRFTWAVRSPDLQRVFGGGASDALPARGALGDALKALRESGQMTFVSGVRVTEIVREGETLTVLGTDTQGATISVSQVDQIVCATGQRPDLAMTSELRLKLDPWLESVEALGSLIDPNLHSCGTVRPHGHRELSHPESGFYSIGVKSYGRAPTFLMLTGYEQARSVVAAIAGDLIAADSVELELPETGVCRVDGSDVSVEGSPCCGSSAPTPAPVRAVTVVAGLPPDRLRALDVDRTTAVAHAPAPCCGPAKHAVVDANLKAQPAPCCG